MLNQDCDTCTKCILIGPFAPSMGLSMGKSVERILQNEEQCSENSPLEDQSSLLKALTMSTVTCGTLPTGSMRRSFETTNSQRSLNPDSGWNNLDSVHSKKLDWNDDDSSKNDSFLSMSMSSSSVASFGESGDEVTDTIAIKEFTKLVEAPTPRAVVMKQHSLRSQRGSSFRGVLTLIAETEYLE